MKRKSLIVSVAISMLVAVFVISVSRGARAVKITVNIKDLPEHGLHIIGSSDPSFDSMLAKVTGDEPAPVVEALRPYSFFLKNISGKHIVAYKIRWECTRPDGTVIYKDSSKSSAWIFTDEAGTDLKRAVDRDDSIIKPNTTWFFSLGVTPRQLDDSPGSIEQGGWSAVIKNESAQGQVASSDKSQALQLIRKELSAYASISIILDGVFFEDGMFAGPNTTDFFGAVKAEVDAKSDVLAQLSKAISQGKAADEVFKNIDDDANGPDVELGANAAPTDYYRFHKKIFSQQLVAQKMSMGSAQTIKHALKRLEKPWPQLRKR